MQRRLNEIRWRGSSEEDEDKERTPKRNEEGRNNLQLI